MEFVGNECHRCGKKFVNRKPKDAVEVAPFTSPADERRIVSVIAPCPFCGEKIPVWGGTDPIPELAKTEPEPEPVEPEPEPVAEPET